MLELLLPSFDAVARLLQPLTDALLRLGRPRAAIGQAADANGAAMPTAPRPTSPAQEAATTPLQEGQARELLRSLVDFRETMVREVMTPRPDIVAIDADATLGELRTLVREQQYSRIPVYNEHARQHRRLHLHQGSDPARAGRPVAADHAADPAGVLRARDQARARSCSKEFQRKRDAGGHRRRRVRRHRRAW